MKSLDLIYSAGAQHFYEALTLFFFYLTSYSICDSILTAAHDEANMPVCQ